MGFGKASFCPVPAGWGPPSAPVVCARGGSATTADEIAPRYRQSPSSLPLPGRCRPGAVEGRVLRMLRAFNIGNGTAFAESFAGADARGSVRVRVGGINKFSTRSALSDFARGRYRAGAGWTLVALSPPNHIDGPYRLQVGVFGRDRAPYASSGKLRVDCRTGLIRRLALPGIGA